MALRIPAATVHPRIALETAATDYKCPSTRLPGKSRFLELFSAQLSTALHPGDSGSWAFGDNGELIGFVVAGNPQTRSCLLLPSKPALQSVWSLLSNREPPRGNRSARTVSELRLDTRDSNDTTPDEDSTTVESSLPPPSIFSLRMDRGATPSTVARSTTTMFYESRPDLSLARGSLSGGNAGLATGTASNGKFLEEQTYRLRRELERAWEIIQEKDKRLQEFGIGNPDEDLNYGAQYTAPSLSKDIGDVQLGFGLGSGLKRRTWSSPPLWEPEVSPLEDLRESNLERPFDFEFSLKGRPKTVEPYLEIDRRNVEDLRNTWQREVDTNYALRKENRELRGGIKQAIEAIHQVNGDGKEAEGHGELVKIATELRRVLHDSGDSGSLPGTVVNVKPEPELNEINLRDIPPFPQEPQGLLNSIPKLPPRQRPHKERRTLTPKGQFHRLSRVPKGHSTSLPVYESKIKTVPEEDEDDEMEDRVATKVENHAREEVKGKDNMLLSPTSTSSRPHDWVQPETAPNLDSDYSPISPRMVLSMNISQETPDLNFHEGAVQHILESSMSDTAEKAPSSSSGKKNEETDDRLTIQEKKDEHEVN
ncbi:hypothetical protein NUW58_g1956 [Xylaria curta]|uniref:Uncharacterized protein n=1 Tax=Xylaria curta TaxID=42375 RepID=A0ACC1PIF6_9PEZI|nr:hypothetical protein NUW58_g1956 [Xylaria curta]